MKLSHKCLSAVSLGGLALAGCLTWPGQPARVGPGLVAENRVSGAADPAAMAFASDGRVFYTEKNTGSIRVIDPDGLLRTPFAQVPVNYAGQRGLLGIALHPDFPTTPRVYVFYTRSDTGASTNNPQAVFDNRVVYFTANGNVATDGEIFVAALPAGSGTEDVAGQIVFSAEGKLLVALGDLTDSAAAADPASLAGKILRYNDDGSIPSDNPTPDSPVFASGLRNPGGLCIDPTDGAVFVIDNGPDGVDEVDRVPAGADLGWPAVVGTADTSAEQAYAADNPSYVDPIYVTRSGTGLLAGCSFNPSTRYGPDVQDQFFFGQAHDRQVMVGEFNSARTAFAETEPFTTRLASEINAVSFTPAGTLYVALTDAVVRLAPSPP
jgi:glucose/arabinose dehydrogenase